MKKKVFTVLTFEGVSLVFHSITEEKAREMYEADKYQISEDVDFDTLVCHEVDTAKDDWKSDLFEKIKETYAGRRRVEKWYDIKVWRTFHRDERRKKILMKEASEALDEVAGIKYDAFPLQYQSSTGRWICPNLKEIEYHFKLLEKWNGLTKEGKVVPVYSDEKVVRPATRDEIKAALKEGEKLRCSDQDWYMNCRFDPDFLPEKEEKEVVYIKCACGHKVPEIHVMSTSSGSSCPDCYDRMDLMEE